MIDQTYGPAAKYAFTGQSAPAFCLTLKPDTEDFQCITDLAFHLLLLQFVVVVAVWCKMSRVSTVGQKKPAEAGQGLEQQGVGWCNWDCPLGLVGCLVSPINCTRCTC